MESVDFILTLNRRSYNLISKEDVFVRLPQGYKDLSGKIVHLN